jgi:predicted Zn-dependent protease
MNSIRFHMFHGPALALVSVLSLLSTQSVSAQQAPEQSSGPASAAAVQDAPIAQEAALSQSLKEITQLIGNAQYDEALQKLDKLAAQAPEPAGVERLRGSVLYEQEKLSAADVAFAKALQQDPSDHVAIQMRGLILFRTGRSAEAVPYLQNANTWLPEINADANYVLGLAYIQTHKYDDARKAFAAVYGFPPDSAASYLLSSRLLLRNEYLPIAQADARKALEIDAKVPLAHQALGEIALAQGHNEEAQVEFEQERASNPLYPGVYDRLGDTYLRLGKLDDAQRALNRAILLDPYSTGPLILLGKVLLKRGDANMASSFLRKAEGMDPRNYQTRMLLGQAYRSMGRKEDATREFNEAERLQTGPSGAAIK